VRQSGNPLDLEKLDRESLLANGPARANRDLHRWSEFDKCAGFLLLGLIYALVLTWLGWGLAGGGHGTALFLAICLPGLLLWPSAGASLALAHRPFGRWVCPALVIIDYLLTLDIINGSHREDPWYLAKAWGGLREYVLAFIAIFLIGQAALWGMYAIKRRNAAGRNSSKGSITIAGAMAAIIIFALLTAIVAIPVRWVISHEDTAEVPDHR
jgi:hypothetical protein